MLVSLVRSASEDAAAGGVVAEIFADDSIALVDSHPGSRLVAALRFLALTGRASELSDLIDAVDDHHDVWPAARAALGEHRDDVRDVVSRGLQNNEVGLSPCLYGALLLLEERYGMPIRLLEVGASAGLNLTADLFGYDIGGQVIGSTQSPLRFREPWSGGRTLPLASVARTLKISHRAGCDLHPIDPTTTEGKHRLLAYLWPDQPALIRRLQVAAAAPMPRPAIDQAPGALWLSKQLAELPDHELTVIWRSDVRAHMSAQVHLRIESVITVAAARATRERPLVSIELEPTPRGTDHLSLVLRSGPDGDKQTLARTSINGPLVVWRLFPS